MFIPKTLVTLLEDNKFREPTINSINYSLQRVHRMFYGKDATYNIEKIIKDHKLILDTLKKDDKIPIGSKKTLLRSIYTTIVVSKIKTDKAKEFLKEIDKYSQYVTEKSKLCAEESVIPLDDVYPLINKLFKQYKNYVNEKYKSSLTLTTYVKFIILAFFKYLPPFRNQDYINTRLYNKIKDSKYDGTENNFISLSHKIFVIINYKTDKTHGRREIELPDKLVDILKDYKKYSESKWLIPKLSANKDLEEQMTSACFTHFVNRIFGDKIGTAELRRAYISKYVINEDMKGSERKKIAKQMGHKLETQSLIYSKYSKICD